MRTTKLVTVSVPPDLLKKAQTVAKEEGRTRSELFREALRFYLTARPLPLPDLTKPRRVSKGQAWFWTKEWLEGEKRANEAIRLGWLYGPFSTVEEFKKASRHSI